MSNEAPLLTLDGMLPESWITNKIQLDIHPKFVEILLLTTTHINELEIKPGAWALWTTPDTGLVFWVSLTFLMQTNPKPFILLQQGYLC